MKKIKSAIIITLLIATSTFLLSIIHNEGVYNRTDEIKYNDTIDLTEYKNKNVNSVPLIMQYDKRWSDKTYAGDFMKNSGCGPTCLSMVSIYLLKNTKFSPLYIADFAENNGYSINGNGSKWTLISEGGNALGLDVKELPLDKNIIITHLKNKDPIICVMGPGDFTTTGHFIVMTGLTDNNKIIINDPNSRKNSKKLWEYDDIYEQIRNLWVCTA